jgi:hypothetical protein
MLWPWRLLAGDHGELRQRGVDDLAVADGLAQAHVHHDLLEVRDLHRVAEPELLHECGAELLLVPHLEPC